MSGEIDQKSYILVTKFLNREGSLFDMVCEFFIFGLKVWKSSQKKIAETNFLKSAHNVQK